MGGLKTGPNSLRVELGYLKTPPLWRGWVGLPIPS